MDDKDIVKREQRVSLLKEDPYKMAKAIVELEKRVARLENEIYNHQAGN